MNSKEKEFIKTVWRHYQRDGRRTLPWRKTRDPYKIMVSELMLQQTQVDRVIPKYKNFLKKFPNASALAKASLGDVLREWQGLGYNRRAQNLHRASEVITDEYKGKLPKTYEELQGLPGIGPYTAGAIMAFAYNKPIPIIETNIRSAYIHHFFNDQTDILESAVLELIERTLDTKKPGEWYAALMDYGSHIKKEFGNPNSKSKSYSKQSKFDGSDRQIRGAILRLLSEEAATRAKLHKKLNFEDIRIDAQLEKLSTEGLIIKMKKSYALPK